MSEAATTTYTPRPGSVPSLVIGWLQSHRGQRISVGGIVQLCHLTGGASVHTMMTLALDAGAVVRTRDDDGEYWYGAGPALADMRVAGADGQPAPRRPRMAVEAGALRICGDPVPETLGSRQGMMWPIFEQLRPGQCIKCRPQETQSVAHALVRWLRIRQPAKAAACIVRSTKQYPGDGQGRVWLLPRPAAGKAGK